MTRISFRLALGTGVAIWMLGAVPAVQAQDFFTALFGGAFHAPAPEISLPYAHEGAPVRIRQSPRSVAVERQAYCVRTCDGRYFPITASDNQSRAASCNSFCPASDTKVVYGSSIDSATTEGGKSYSELPNAFRYRTELVAGCTCNGKDQIGLASVKLENDPTLRKGDIVASADGLMVTGRGADKSGASLNMSPASRSVRAKYERVPVVAQN